MHTRGRCTASGRQSRTSGADRCRHAAPGQPRRDSDYSGFLSQGVSEELRNKALRKLFLSPQFNVVDGLDDYCEDFTSFELLGDVITADMRHELEMEAERAKEKIRLEEQEVAHGAETAAHGDSPPGAAPAQSQKETAQACGPQVESGSPAAEEAATDGADQRRRSGTADCDDPPGENTVAGAESSSDAAEQGGT